MKFNVNMRLAHGNRERAVTVSLRPDILHALRLKPGAPLAAILDRRITIVIPAEDAQAREPMLGAFPDEPVFIRDLTRECDFTAGSPAR